MTQRDAQILYVLSLAALLGALALGIWRDAGA